jgi:hypothetical protein
MGRDPLEGLIWKETFAEILDLLTPEEKVVAMLRVEGLSDGEIGRLLDVDRAAVGMKMIRVRRRITQRLPHLSLFLSGRRRRGGAVWRPLEEGWIGDFRLTKDERRMGRKDASVSPEDVDCGEADGAGPEGPAAG